MPRLPLLTAATVATLAAGTAQAHAPGALGLAAGVAHPFLGPDHLMAMVAVGLLAVRQDGPAWRLPAVFVAAMAAGLGLGGLGIGGALEIGILGSVVVLGGLLAWGGKVPAAALMAAVALSAALHGHAHGVEMPAGGAALTYAAGALSGTAILHLIGVSAAHLMKEAMARATGGVFAAGAVVLALV